MSGQCSDTFAERCALVIITIVLLTGCHKPPSLPADNPAYFDKVFHQLDSMNLPMDRSFQFIDSVYSHFASPGVLDRLRWYDYKGNYYFYQAHDLGSAMRYIDSSLLLLSGPEKESRYPREYAKCLIDKAEVCQLENNDESALFYYRKGLAAIRDLGDSCTMAEYTQRIAMASYRAGRYADARNLFGLARLQFAACGPEFRSFAYEQCNLDNIGECYAAMGKWDSAAFYYDSTLAFIAREEQSFLHDSSHRTYIETARAVVYGNQGDGSLYRRDTAKAWQLYRSSIAVNLRPLHDSGNALVVLVKAAGLDLSQGHLPEARADLQLIRTMLDRRPDPNMDLAWRKLHSEWLAKSGDLSGAWKSLNTWSDQNDSLRAAKTPVSTVDVPGELVHLEDKYTIQLLQQRDHIKTVYLLLAL
ncbi:MAG: hypothetical protein ABUM51_07490, partial [Bacteroidota bacterium]